jgi:hypothetical protein
VIVVCRVQITGNRPTFIAQHGYKVRWQDAWAPAVKLIRSGGYYAWVHAHNGRHWLERLFQIQLETVESIP